MFYMFSPPSDPSSISMVQQIEQIMVKFHYKDGATTYI